MIIGYEQFGAISDFYMEQTAVRQTTYQNSTTVSTEKTHREEPINLHRNISNTNQQNNKLFQSHFLFVRKEKEEIKEKQNMKKKDCLIRVYYSSDEEDDASQITMASQNVLE